MRRNKAFVSPGRQFLRDHPDAQLQEDQVHGPLPFLNPTHALFNIRSGKDDTSPPTSSSAEDEDQTRVSWRSRDNRKGRHVLVVPRTASSKHTPRPTNSLSAIGRGIWRMCTVFAWWDVSWWIGVLFSIGSALFVACGLFYWLPLEAPSTEFPGIDLGGGLTSLIGATFFQAGAILLIFEACNENQSGCFGWALEQVFSHNSDKTSKESSPTPAPDQCQHHHVHGIHHKSTIHRQHPQVHRTWEWWPTWREVREHYIHEIGWLASITEALGATIFYVAGIMALPQIYDHLSQGLLWGLYWLTYLVGGILFIASSALYMLETQSNWYTPAPRVLGWWIGFFNMVGSVGWTLSASFGYCDAGWCEYQGELSLLWASCAFMVGSLLLWYEALDKHPVVEEAE